jgi:hypothetical protein
MACVIHSQEHGLISRDTLFSRTKALQRDSALGKRIWQDRVFFIKGRTCSTLRQRFGLLQVFGIKALGEPVVALGQLQPRMSSSGKEIFQNESSRRRSFPFLKTVEFALYSTSAVRYCRHSTAA